MVFTQALSKSMNLSSNEHVDEVDEDMLMYR